MLLIFIFMLILFGLETTLKICVRFINIALVCMAIALAIYLLFYGYIFYPL